MAPADINDPSGYYSGGENPSLFWEMTVCQSLADGLGPLQTALSHPAPYGKILARFLESEAGFDPSWSVVEVGGGYGTLMAALHDAVPAAHVTMVDVSPFFSGEQRRRLGSRPGFRFVTSDVFDFLRDRPPPVDLVVSNENLGDLPTVTGISREELVLALSSGTKDGLLGEVADRVRHYGLDLGDVPKTFHFNLGAIRYLEALRPVAHTVFLSEHGADTVLPPRYDFLPLALGDGYPRRIRLKGHDEYSIRFGHLERVAQALGYRVRRLHMAELLGLRDDQGLRAMARASAIGFEKVELIHEFCAHVAEYQCMLLTS